MVFDDGEEITIEGKKFIVHKAPATVAYDFAVRYKIALDKKDPDEVMKCTYLLLKYVELVLEDGRKIALDNVGIINQHLTSATDLLQLQQKAVAVNFNSSPAESH